MSDLTKCFTVNLKTDFTLDEFSGNEESVSLSGEVAFSPSNPYNITVTIYTKELCDYWNHLTSGELPIMGVRQVQIDPNDNSIARLLIAPGGDS